jgi:hypothetical protein
MSSHRMEAQGPGRCRSVGAGTRPAPTGDRIGAVAGWGPGVRAVGARRRRAPTEIRHVRSPDGYAGARQRQVCRGDRPVAPTRDRAGAGAGWMCQRPGRCGAVGVTKEVCYERDCISGYTVTKGSSWTLSTHLAQLQKGLDKGLDARSSFSKQVKRTRMITKGIG